MTTLGDLIPVPPDELYPKDDDSKKPDNKTKREEYENMLKSSPNDVQNAESELNKKHGARWWSLHHLMKVFGSGFLPTENNATYIGYKIDFTAPEINLAKTQDPVLAAAVEQNMLPSLRELENKIDNEFNQQKLVSAQQLQQGTMAALARNNNMPGNMPGNAPGAIDPVTGLAVPVKPYSAENIEAECLKDLNKIVLTSKNRVFVTDGKARALVFGGAKRKGRKTRKGVKKHGKKGKTHRKHRKHRR